MISVFIREQRRYTFDELEELLAGSRSDLKEILKQLKLNGIVKNVKKTSEEANLSDLTNEEESYDDSPDKVFYVFTYVGIVAVKDVVLKCCPKYLKKTSDYNPVLKQALRVIEKYDRQSQQLDLYSDLGEKMTVNRLAIMIFLLQDYYDYGLYSEVRDIIAENGRGEILWDKTVNTVYPIISDGEPFYSTVYTRYHVTDDENFFRRLHACILGEVSKEMEEAGLIDLFDISGLPHSDEKREDLGDADYILYRIDREIDIQFNTRKNSLLQAMAIYISNKSITADAAETFSMFGTTRFNLIWENVCNDVFGDERNIPMGSLLLPQKLNNGYKRTEPLISVIERPEWCGLTKDGSYFYQKADKTLIPDFLAIRKLNGKYKFVILDAKYYNLQFEKNMALKGQPGIESITKQYLYELAYKDFIQKHGIESVINCFLFPTEEDTVQDKGYVRLDFLHSLGLKNIAVRLVPVRKIFDDYLADRKIDISILKLS